MYADPGARGGVLEPEGVCEIKFRTPDLIKMMHRQGRAAGAEGGVEGGGRAGGLGGREGFGRFAGAAAVFKASRQLTDIYNTPPYPPNHTHAGWTLSCCIAYTVLLVTVSLCSSTHVHRVDPVIAAARAAGTPASDPAIRARERELLPTYGRIARAFADMHDTPVRMAAKGVLTAIVPWAGARAFFATRLRRRLLEQQLLRHAATTDPSLTPERAEALLLAWREAAEASAGAAAEGYGGSGGGGSGGGGGGGGGGGSSYGDAVGGGGGGDGNPMSPTSAALEQQLRGSGSSGAAAAAGSSSGGSGRPGAATAGGGRLLTDTVSAEAWAARDRAFLAWAESPAGRAQIAGELRSMRCSAAEELVAQVGGWVGAGELMRAVHGWVGGWVGAEGPGIMREVSLWASRMPCGAVCGCAGVLPLPHPASHTLALRTPHALAPAPTTPAGAGHRGGQGGAAARAAGRHTARRHVGAAAQAAAAGRSGGARRHEWRPGAGAGRGCGCWVGGAGCGSGGRWGWAERANGAGAGAVVEVRCMM